MVRSNMNTAAGGLAFALRCADTVLRGIDRRRPEARAVAAWLDEFRERLGLPEGEDFCSGREPRATLPAASWRRVRGTITRLLRAGSLDADTMADRWAEVLAQRLGLTGLDRHLLGLAMVYRADESVEHLVDAISHARGRNRSLSADPALLALILDHPPHEVEAALLPDGRLLGSGLLEVGDCSSLRVHAQVVRLVRRAIPPGHDPVERLLGPALPAALPPEAFAPYRAASRHRRSLVANGTPAAGARHQHPAVWAAGHRQDLVRRDPGGTGRRRAAGSDRTGRLRQRADPAGAAVRPPAGAAPGAPGGDGAAVRRSGGRVRRRPRKRTGDVPRVHAPAAGAHAGAGDLDRQRYRRARPGRRAADERCASR